MIKNPIPAGKWKTKGESNKQQEEENMKNLNLQRAIDRYDRIIYDHIGEEASTIENPGWNLRDIVAEADYWLGTFYDCGHSNDTRDDWALDDTGEMKKEWFSATGKLKRFIAAYEPFIHDMVCTEPHGSDRFDNCPDMRR